MNAPMSTNPVPDGAEKNRPILVVDDSRAQRRLLTKALARWGHSTIEADCGEAALELCRITEIEFVISDWMMPGMSGVAFCRAYRKMMGNNPAYFILLTAQSEREVLAEGLESGADRFSVQALQYNGNESKDHRGRTCFVCPARSHREKQPTATNA